MTSKNYEYHTLYIDHIFGFNFSPNLTFIAQLFKIKWRHYPDGSIPRKIRLGSYVNLNRFVDSCCPMSHRRWLIWALMIAWQDLIAVCTALVSKIRLADNEVVDNESVDYEKDRILDDRNGLVLDKSRRVEIVENGKRWVKGLKFCSQCLWYYCKCSVSTVLTVSTY